MDTHGAERQEHAAGHARMTAIETARYSASRAFVITVRLLPEPGSLPLVAVDCEGRWSASARLSWLHALSHFFPDRIRADGAAFGSSH